MNYRILFLDGNSEKEFYNNERNKYENVYATNIFYSNHIFIRILRRIFLKLRIPLNFLLFGNWKSNLNNYDLIIISASFYSGVVHKYISLKTKSRIVHWYWNLVSKGISPRSLGITNYELWSFDKKDCNRFKMNFNYTYYFSSIKLKSSVIYYDIYFIGADKGRLNQLLQLESVFKKFGLKTNFHITKSKRINVKKRYQFKNKITYKEVLENISKSRVILDYVQQGQEGLSQRVMESIFFKKKLITNDSSIKNYNFYRTENIYVLEDGNYQGIVKFINTEYIDIEREIIEKYDFNSWVNYIISIKKCKL